MAEATTTPVHLTSGERLQLAMLLLDYPKDKMTVDIESKLFKAWNRLNLPDDLKRTEATLPDGRAGIKTEVVGDRTMFELTAKNCEFLASLPCDYTGATALVMGPIREKMNEAKLLLDKAG